jgi:hypothetical protein
MIVGDVNLYENDIFIGKLRQKERNYYELPGFKPSAGKSYRLEASSGKMKPVSATVVVPDLIPPSSFDTARITMDNGHPAIHVSLQITDPGGQENYYALQVTGIHRYFDYFLHKFTDSIVAYPFYAKLNGKVNDPLDLDFLDVNRDVFLDRKQIFSDQLFNGKKFDMSFDIPSEDWSMKADTVEVWIDLQQVDKSYYLYAVSEQKYQQTRNNPFTEPVQVYSNVKNGFGLFSAYNGTRKEFIVDWTR